MAKWIAWERERGEPLMHGRYVVTPVSGHLRVRLRHFHFTWNRPLAVEVAEDGATYTLPIRDVTRRAQLTLWSAGVAAGAAIWLARRSRAGRHV